MRDYLLASPFGLALGYVAGDHAFAVAMAITAVCGVWIAVLRMVAELSMWGRK